MSFLFFPRVMICYGCVWNPACPQQLVQFFPKPHKIDTQRGKTKFPALHDTLYASCLAENVTQTSKLNLVRLVRRKATVKLASRYGRVPVRISDTEYYSGGHGNAKISQNTKNKTTKTGLTVPISSPLARKQSGVHKKVRLFRSFG